MLNKKIYLNKLEVKVVKFVIISIFQIVLLSVWIPLVIMTAKSFFDFGWAVNDLNTQIPESTEAIRIWLMFITMLIIFSSSYSFYIAIELKKKEINWFFGLGIFDWVFIVNSIKMANRLSAWSYFWKYVTQNIYEEKLISIKSIWQTIIRKKSFTKLDGNTLIYFFTLIAFLLGVIAFNIIVKSEAKILNSFIFSVVSYFTHMTNLLCFVFLLLLPIIQRKKVMSNNSLMINLCVYIIVVGFVFWAFLFPGQIITNQLWDNTIFENIRFIWLHTVTPILFLTLTIHSQYVSKRDFIGKYWEAFSVNSIFPSFYSLYSFSLPFVSRVSVYGPFTDCNPYGYVFFGGELKQIGSWFSLVWILIILSFFAIVLLIVRTCLKKVTKSKCVLIY